MIDLESRLEMGFRPNQAHTEVEVDTSCDVCLTEVPHGRDSFIKTDVGCIYCSVNCLSKDEPDHELLRTDPRDLTAGCAPKSTRHSAWGHDGSFRFKWQAKLWTLLNNIKKWFKRTFWRHKWDYRNPYDRYCSVCHRHEVVYSWNLTGSGIHRDHWVEHDEGDVEKHYE